jgi:predicted DNA binding CopG/RHH family protein
MQKNPENCRKIPKTPENIKKIRKFHPTKKKSINSRLSSEMQAIQKILKNLLNSKKC